MKEKFDIEQNGQRSRIIELRNYLLRPGERDRFSEFFAENLVAPQAELGGFVLGQFAVDGEPDRFFWIRGFEDMDARGRFLRHFYLESAPWRLHRTEANSMMLDFSNVHLLKPLPTPARPEGVPAGSFANGKNVVKIDYYYAREGSILELVDFFNEKYIPYVRSQGVDGATFWTSELAENDFPQLPVFQDENLVVAITAYDDDRDHRVKSDRLRDTCPELEDRLEELTKSRQTLVVRPTGRIVAGAAG